MKEQVRTVLDEKQRATAKEIEGFAAALRTTAERLEGDTTSARLAQNAAAALERVSGTLRERDIAAMVREAESFARRQPAAFLGIAVAAGFLAVRFLKSSSAPGDEAPSSSPQHDRDFH